MKNISFNKILKLALYFISILFINQKIYAQSTIEDLCLIPGQQNTQTFNCINCTFSQTDPNKCIRVSKTGQTSYSISYIGGDDANCCGKDSIRYIVDDPVGGNPERWLVFTVKCPKPECGLVELDITPAGGTSGGMNPPQDPPCLYSCEKSVANYYVTHVPGNVYNWTVTGGTYVVNSSGSIDVTWGPNGSGNIQLTITNGSNVNSYSFCVKILEGPTAAFTPLDTCTCLNSPISFQNNSVNGSSFYWDFGDGNNSTAFSPTHNYANGGTYCVTLVVTKDNYDDKGNPLCCCTDSIKKVITIDPNPGPNIYWISTLCAGDSSKYWTDVPGCSYTWNVKDANGNVVSFSGQGNDTICVAWGNGPHGVVTLQLGNCPGYCTKPVSALVPIIPTTAIIDGPIKVCKNTTGTYTLPKWMTTQYDWMVMGGTITSLDTHAHTVTILWGNGPLGMITVNYHSDFLQGLPGHDSEDCEGVAGLKVSILPEFKLNASPPNMFCVGTSYTFGAMPVLAPGGYHWTISHPGSPSASGTASYNVNFTTAGNYILKLWPVNPNIFCNDTIWRSIKVVKTPAVDSITGNGSICPSNIETYTAHTTATGTFFTWTATSNGVPVTYTGNPAIITWGPSGPYTLSVIQTGLSMPNCPSLPISKPITIKSIMGMPVISGPNGCTSQIQSYSIAPIQDASATYTWTIMPAINGSVVSGQGTPNVNVQWNNVPLGVTLICTVNLCGTNHIYSKAINLVDALIPTITQGGFLCPGGSATLNATPGFTTYNWSSVGVAPSSIPVTAAGLYVLTSTDANGCQAITTFTAVASPLPVAAISTPSPNNICVLPTTNYNIVLYAMTNPTYSYQWFCTPPSGPTVITAPSTTLDTFIHNVNGTIGTWSYQLRVTDIVSGCMKMSNVITIMHKTCMPAPCPPQPVTIAGINANPFCNQVTFSHSPNFTVGSWDFGDPPNGYSGTINNPTHVFSAAGYYVVWATGSSPNASGGTPSQCPVDTFTSVCIPAAASFTILPGPCGKFTFTSTSTVLPSDSIVNCQWTFGDPSLAVNSCGSVMHTYMSSGSFTVTLLITTSSGCQATISQTVNVVGPPTAIFTMTKDTACVGESIMFMPSVPINIVSYLWDFGDGSQNEAQSPKHSYTAQGVYPVQLIVENIYGCKDTFTQNIVVYPNPTGSIVLMPNTPIFCQGDSVKLTANGVGGTAPYTYMWSTGDTSQSIFVFNSGVYKVTITDLKGCKFVPDSVKITVRQPPIAMITGSHFICGSTGGDCITLSATSGSGYTYAWSNGFTSPTILVCGNAVASPYIVTITDSYGCKATSAPWTVSVVTPPTVAITVIGSLCEGDTSILSVTTILPNVVYNWNTNVTATSILATLPGTYTVVATDTLTGCNASAFVTVNPKPDLCVVPTGCYEVCIPDTICGPPGMVTYQWNYNGAPLAGATMQCLEVTQAGSYNLTASNNFGCYNTSDSLYLETTICCDSNDINITALPTDDAGCCWNLSFMSMIDSIFAMTITGVNADLVASNIVAPFMIIGSSPNSVTIANVNPLMQLPQSTISNFVKICFSNITSSPVNVQIDYLGQSGNVLCNDSLKLECDVEPDCAYIVNPSIQCVNGVVTYTATVCNPADAAFAISYAQMTIVSPAGIIATPSSDSFASPLLPGQCTTFVTVLSGGNFANQQFCYKLTVHNANPALVDSTLCCTTDTTYCIRIPGCNPCDKVAVDRITEDPKRECCFNVSLYNGHSATAFTGVMLNLLTTGSTFAVNNVPW